VQEGVDRIADPLNRESIPDVARLDGDGLERTNGSPAKAQDAYATLHRAIRDGRLAPGSRLKEVELAERLGMSRTPIREAIRQLQRDGVVTVLPNRGAVVRELSEQEIDDTYSLRAVLEGYCASRAAIRIDPEGLRRLGEIHADFARRFTADGSLAPAADGSDPETDIEALIDLNRAFHTEILLGSKNSRVIEVLQKAIEVPVHMKDLFWRSPEARLRAMMSHGDILEAVRAADAVRADAVMRTHVYALRDFFIQEHRALHLRQREEEEEGPVSSRDGARGATADMEPAVVEDR
jgi:DNA-binding GntR family transcriptional regulator